MSGRALIFNAAYIGIALAGAVAVWLVLGLLGLAVEAPARAAITWLGDVGGPAAVAAFVILGPVAFWTLGARLGRRDFRRQYAADKTIHVEKPRRFRVVHALAIYAVALVAFCVAILLGNSG